MLLGPNGMGLWSLVSFLRTGSRPHVTWSHSQNCTEVVVTARAGACDHVEQHEVA